MREQPFFAGLSPLCYVCMSAIPERGQAEFN